MTKDDKLIYVERNGETVDGRNVYSLYFSENATSVPNDDWFEDIAGLCSDLRPNIVKTEVVTVTTEVPLDLAQDCMCLGMVDAMNGIVSLAWENIDSYTEYPEDGRLILRHGEKRSSVIGKLEARSADISV